MQWGVLVRQGGGCWVGPSCAAVHNPHRGLGWQLLSPRQSRGILCWLAACAPVPQETAEPTLAKTIPLLLCVSVIGGPLAGPRCCRAPWASWTMDSLGGQSRLGPDSSSTFPTFRGPTLRAACPLSHLQACSRLSSSGRSSSSTTSCLTHRGQRRASSSTVGSHLIMRQTTEAGHHTSQRPAPHPRHTRATPAPHRVQASSPRRAWQLPPSRSSPF